MKLEGEEANLNESIIDTDGREGKSEGTSNEDIILH